jgi:hypothetical protein
MTSRRLNGLGIRLGWEKKVSNAYRSLGNLLLKRFILKNEKGDKMNLQERDVENRISMELAEDDTQ